MRIKILILMKMSSPLASLNITFEEQEKNDEEQEQNEQKDHLLWLQTN